MTSRPLTSVILVLLILITGCTDQAPNGKDGVAEPSSKPLHIPNDALSIGLAECERANLTYGPGSRDNCLYELASVQNSTFPCTRMRRIEGAWSHDACLVKVAELLRDARVCTLIEREHGPSSRDRCNLNLALAKGDHALCLLVPLSNEYNSRDYCLMRVAALMRNPDICDLITLRTAFASEDRCRELALEGLPDGPPPQSHVPCTECR